MPVSRLINRNVVAERGRTSAVRVFVLGYYRAAATEHGHGLAGHGGLPRSRLPRAARTAA